MMIRSSYSVAPCLMMTGVVNAVDAVNAVDEEMMLFSADYIVKFSTDAIDIIEELSVYCMAGMMDVGNCFSDIRCVLPTRNVYRRFRISHEDLMIGESGSLYAKNGVVSVLSVSDGDRTMDLYLPREKADLVYSVLRQIKLHYEKWENDPDTVGDYSLREYELYRIARHCKLIERSDLGDLEKYDPVCGTYDDYDWLKKF